jgi:hypothetical protein
MQKSVSNHSADKTVKVTIATIPDETSTATSTFYISQQLFTRLQKHFDADPQFRRKPDQFLQHVISRGLQGFALTSS